MLNDYFSDMPVEYGGDVFDEGSKEDALKSLNAIIGFLGKQKNANKGMVKMARGIKDYTDKNDGSMSPDQAKWVWNTSKALF